MIHKFVANDNKGNVNTFEVTSTGTKLGKVALPEDLDDAVTLRYLAEDNNMLVTFIPAEESLAQSSYNGYGEATCSNAEIAEAFTNGKRVVGVFPFFSQEVYFEISAAALVEGSEYPTIYAFCPAIGYQNIQEYNEETGEYRDTENYQITSAAASWLVMPASNEPSYKFAYEIQ